MSSFKVQQEIQDSTETQTLILDLSIMHECKKFLLAAMTGYTVISTELYL